MAEMNGFVHHDDLDEVAEEIKNLAMTLSPRVQEFPEPSKVPFEQKTHDLMMESIDRIATDWVDRMRHVRENSEAVEQIVMQRVAKVKAQITALYLLGSAVAAEAKRGDDVNQKLASELERVI